MGHWPNQVGRRRPYQPRRSWQQEPCDGEVRERHADDVAQAIAQAGLLPGARPPSLTQAGYVGVEHQMVEVGGVAVVEYDPGLVRGARGRPEEVAGILAGRALADELTVDQDWLPQRCPKEVDVGEVQVPVTNDVGAALEGGEETVARPPQPTQAQGQGFGVGDLGAENRVPPGLRIAQEPLDKPSGQSVQIALR